MKASSTGLITPEKEQDIVYLVDHADMKMWRPLVYVINRAAVAARLQEVKASERANPVAKEFIVSDLSPDEFDVIELEA